MGNRQRNFGRVSAGYADIKLGTHTAYLGYGAAKAKTGTPSILMTAPPGRMEASQPARHRDRASGGYLRGTGGEYLTGVPV